MIESVSDGRLVGAPLGAAERRGAPLCAAELRAAQLLGGSVCCCSVESAMPSSSWAAQQWNLGAPLRAAELRAAQLLGGSVCCCSAGSTMPSSSWAAQQCAGTCARDARAARTCDSEEDGT